LFSQDALGRVRLIRGALSIGFSVSELSEILRERDHGGAPCRRVRKLAANKLVEIEEQLRDLQCWRRELRETLAGWDLVLRETPRGKREGLLEAFVATHPKRQTRIVGLKRVPRGYPKREKRLSVLVSALRGGYPQIEMRLKLLIALLIVALSGANPVTAAMCASYCASSKSAETEVAHHHHNGTQPNNQNSHVHGHGMGCPECPSPCGLSQSSNCIKSAQEQAIKEDSASQGQPGGNAFAYVATLPPAAQEPIGNPECQLRLDTSEGIRSSHTPPAPLRI